MEQVFVQYQTSHQCLDQTILNVVFNFSYIFFVFTLILGWKVLQVGKTCKSSHVEMSKAHNAGECANSVRNAGGTFFEFSQEVDGTGKCWWEQTTSADCVEGWETGKSYDFYSLTGKCLLYRVMG